MRLSNMLQELGRPVAYYPSLAEITGVQACVLLCQLYYWSDKGSDPDWIYKSQDELREETGLKPDAQRTARTRLKALGLLEEQNKKLEHRIYFKVIPDALNDLWERVNLAKQGIHTSGDGEPPLREVANPNLVTITETTPETTAEITEDIGASSEEREGKDGLDGKNTSPSEPPEALDPTPSTSETPQTPPTPKKSTPQPSEAQVLALYQAYPRHLKPIPAKKAIVKALGKVDYDTLMAAVVEFAEARALFPKADTRFAPYPATWFNGGQWEDDRIEWYPAGHDPKEAAFQKRLKEIKEKMSDWDNTTPAEGVRLNKERLALMERGHL